ncbi:MAG TPA: UDP-N-acetylglucosamine 2-epimerase (non-hydrolyzing) [bacterium]|nr:UDP-N-acetylglucosamine 2-epimerase (non-hydrolyzing) [bacterium]
MPERPLAVVVGTRPEIIKMAPIVRFCMEHEVPYSIVHTGQHYSFEMDRIFFRDLELPDPDVKLDVGSGYHGDQTGRLLTGIESVLIHKKPGAVLVEGDTNTVLAGGLAAVKLMIPVGHVEAGLRSYDRTMPEEINRILVDHLSHWLFTPTEEAQIILRKEGIDPSRIHITGNTIVDSVYQNLPIARKRGDLKKMNLESGRYMILTLHRQENVDNPLRLRNILNGVDKVSQDRKIEVIYPVHPRTRKRLKAFDIHCPKGIRLIEPVGYLDFLFLMSESRLILTDSGGIQEEACILKRPCVTLRDNTERPETLRVGSNALAGAEPEHILEQSSIMWDRDGQWENPFGDGNSSEIIIRKVLSDELFN